MQAHVAPHQPSPHLSLLLCLHTLPALFVMRFYFVAVCVLNDILYACNLRVCVHV